LQSVQQHRSEGAHPSTLARASTPWRRTYSLAREPMLLRARPHPGARAAGPGGEEVPPIFVDRAGAKVALLQQQSRNSRSSVGAVLEQVPACLPALAAQQRVCPSALGAAFIRRPMLDGSRAGLVRAPVL